MKWLMVHVEGQTEETFVREILRPHLLTSGYESIRSRLLGKGHENRRTGGIKGWPDVRREIVTHLSQNPGFLATTMVDYYGLPQAGEKAWPGRAHSCRLPLPLRASHVAECIARDLAEYAPPEVSRRFVPFITLHEFEALLFSDCVQLATGVQRPELARDLQKIREVFASPEEINDSPQTSPAKRIEALIPEYRKPVMGVQVLQAIGLDKVRRECPHFDRWLVQLEDWLRK